MEIAAELRVLATGQDPAVPVAGATAGQTETLEVPPVVAEVIAQTPNAVATTPAFVAAAPPLVAVATGTEVVAAVDSKVKITDFFKAGNSKKTSPAAEESGNSRPSKRSKTEEYKTEVEVKKVSGAVDRVVYDLI